MNFDASTRTFSEIPLDTHVSTTNITVTADDGNDGSITHNFDLVIGKSNGTILLANTIDNLITTEGIKLSSTFPNYIFLDTNSSNNNDLTYTANIT